MYTNEQKILAVELYVKYCFSLSSVQYELGYPKGKASLRRWYKEYEAGALTLDSHGNRSKFTPEQRKAAVEYYLSHGKSVSRTIRALGYPRPTTLCDWLNLG